VSRRCYGRSRREATARRARFDLAKAPKQNLALILGKNLKLDEVNAIRSFPQPDCADGLAILFGDIEVGVGQALLEPLVLRLLVPGSELMQHDLTVESVMKLAKEWRIARRCST
jgi:hypothetical protein